MNNKLYPMSLTIDCATVACPSEWFGYWDLNAEVYHPTQFVKVLETPGSQIVLKNFHKTNTRVLSSGLASLIAGLPANYEVARHCKTINLAEDVEFFIEGKAYEIDQSILDKILDRHCCLLD